MPVELKDIQDVAEELTSRFTEFKSANDSSMEATRAEVIRLTEKTDKLNAQLSELEALKKELDGLYKKQNRPGTVEGDAEYRKHFIDQWMRKNNAADIEAKAVNLGANQDGGFGVPEELDRQILELERELSPMRALCRNIQVSTDGYKRLVNLGGAGSGWVGETDARPETNTPKLAQIEAFMGEIYANPATTQKALDDVYFNVEQWIADEVAQEFVDREADAFLNGDGVGKPKGILAYAMDTAPDASREFGKLQRVISGKAGDFNADNLLSVIYRLKKAFRRNANWMMTGTTVEKVRKFKDADGNYMWRPGIEAGQPSLLLGYGIEENEDMPEVAADANAILFGDFMRGYSIVDRIGARMLRDPYTHKPFVHFYTTKRVGGMLVDSNAIKVLTLSKGA
ncbi:phage major capsid protein, HK97 family [Hahella chejuensis KCTC 2396]|uniref:Phage major capsid protein, HK97 family n=1 Tax=Hahella chejuensis (strain KCTC 2396) TaxID=349521 RepID=Q2SDM1_HAHCH|nr:phage major capsid protein [Hahella chejuensis]ABC31253.1 phage major capsid protein, HK97 family [Hahella chejuensis KCTC 2396]